MRFDYRLINPQTIQSIVLHIHISIIHHQVEIAVENCYFADRKQGTLKLKIVTQSINLLHFN